MFRFETIHNKRIMKSEIIKGCECFFTTRESVVTAKDLKNLEKSAQENLAQIADYLGVQQDNIIIPQQTHSCNISIAQKGQIYLNTDALVTDRADIALLLNFADCTPVIIYDEIKNIGAVAHAGWRGTAQSIVAKTVRFMNEQYKTEPSDISAIIGPAISMKNYQVDENVYKQIKATLNNDYDDYYTYDSTCNKYNIDLKTVNEHQLEELGVKRIDKCKYCTYDSNDIFFSYRKESGITARHSAILKLIK